MKQVVIYTQSNNQKPFEHWLNSLDKKLQSKVITKIYHLKSGNYSGCSILKGTNGVKECRIKTASGLRLYFSEKEQKIIILLAGGDKDTQKKDIQLAKKYLDDYKQRRQK